MKAMSMVRGSVMAMVLALGVTLAGTASARDEASESSCVPDPLNPSAVVCTIGGSGGGASTFLGAFAADNNGLGGWTEYYSDEEGEWWVEHHSDGSTSVGWEGGGGNYLTGPKMSFGSKEGSYNNKSKPAVKGTPKKGPVRSFAAAKALAATKTGTMMPLAAPAKVSTYAPSFEVSLAGSGQCKANLVVLKNGQFVSSSGIVPMSFPSKRTVALPTTEGEYTISLQGRDGCVGQIQTTKVVVQRPVLRFAPIVK